jgi:hypothetical protein
MSTLRRYIRSWTASALGLTAVALLAVPSGGCGGDSKKAGSAERTKLKVAYLGLT